MTFQITGIPEADRVLDDDPFAVVVALLLDQQYGMEHAFRGPYKILERFGTLDPHAIADADPELFAALSSSPPAIHRYPGAMSKRVQALARYVVDTFDGDVAQLWEQATSGRDLLQRARELPGYGEQKAKILVALLGKQMGVQPYGWKAAAGDYAKPGHRSVADVVDTESLQRVRDYKKAQKARAKRDRAG